MPRPPVSFYPWKLSKVQLAAAHHKRVTGLLVKALTFFFGSRPAWLLPSPSGLNAQYQSASVAKLFSQLRLWAKDEHQRRT